VLKLQQRVSELEQRVAALESRLAQGATGRSA
jgi:BMFP domain-containing protein YqiC